MKLGRVVLAFALLGLLAGCVGQRARGGSADPIDAHLGVYRGSFGDTLTEDRADDVNFVPCDPRQARCLGGDAPLADVLLEIARDTRGAVRLAFYRNPADRAAGRTLDLLGAGCGTRIDALETLGRGSAADGWVATFPITADNRLCLNKLRPTTRHEIRVELGHDPASGIAVAEPRIDRDVKSENYLYVEEGGVRRRVRIDLDNTLVEGPARRYRVCIEDEFGDYTRCVLTDRELKTIVLPVPLPGGGGVGVAWWEELAPDLKRTRGLYRLEQYGGRFERIGSGDSQTPTD
jgi:hypothetical protein